MQFCKLEELHNESDVEHKLLWPFLTSPLPNGLGLSTAEVQTKPNLKDLVIEKGTSKKLYRPDYAIVQSGLPVAVGEAKRPGEAIEEALREARLYAAALNGLYRSDFNPCKIVFACNGEHLAFSYWDTEQPFTIVAFDEILPTNPKFADLLAAVGKSSLETIADELLRTLTHDADVHRPLNIIGGHSMRNEEVGYNEFGAKLAIDFMHLFSPQTPKQRIQIVRNAYVSSRRREHYADEIDRVVRNALPRKKTGTTLLEDSSNPTELIHALGRGRELQSRVMLLVGSVGSGKSTFVDYFRDVKLPQNITDTTFWLTIDFNKAPPTIENLESWMIDQLIGELRNSQPDTDFDEWKTIEKVFGVEINRLRKGELSLLSPGTPEYNAELYKRIKELTGDKQTVVGCLARHLAGDRGRLVIVVLDNADKGDRNEQIAAFRAVQWLQSWLPCLVFLPIRDVTYEAYKNTPPLDTVIKEFVFRIEPPQFTKVLQERIRLALEELKRSSGSELLEYSLENGMRVVYPSNEIGVYLACIYRSLYDHDQLLRRMLVGLAGKNIRRAMEIFLDFCKSGHIGSQEILKIRHLKGNYTLPFHVVTRVLLRLNRRFYDGDSSHIKNLFQSDPSERFPNNFTRLAILSWLQVNQKKQGPAGTRGFHRADSVASDLVLVGCKFDQVAKEMQYLLKAGCIYAEHQRLDSVSMEDLIVLAPAGFATLKLISQIDYLAACSEDTWTIDPDLADAVAKRITLRGIRGHYTLATMEENAIAFAKYLKSTAETIVPISEANGGPTIVNLQVLTTAIQERVLKATRRAGTEAWNTFVKKFPTGESFKGTVEGFCDAGVFVRLPDGPVGFLHKSRLAHGMEIKEIKKGDTTDVEILFVDPTRNRVGLQAAVATE